MQDQEQKSEVGLIGLGVMGGNLARNIADKGFSVVVYNRTYAKTQEFLEKYPNSNIQGFQTIEEFIRSLERPRKIILLVKAGAVVDTVLEQLIPLLEKDDVIIDCGNSNYKDTQRRFNIVEKNGIHFIGCGVSGGEDGALRGPSLMPGGTKASWEKVQPIFEAIAAKDFNGKPCVTYVGDNGAGQYVKTVHNGIEYGVMQLMAEAYMLLKDFYKLSPPEIAKIFDEYNYGE